MTSSAFQRSPSKVWWAQGLDDNPHSEWHRTGSGSPNSHKSQDSGFSDSEISPSITAAETKIRQKTENQITHTENLGTPKRIFSSEIIPTDILKDISYVSDTTPKKNFKENIKEKYSPKKSITKHLTEESLKKTTGQRLYEKRTQCCRSAPSTPRNQRRYQTSSKSETPSPVHSPYMHRNERLSLYNPPDRSQENLNFDTPHRAYDKTESRSEPRRSKQNKYSPRVNRNLLNCYPDDSDSEQNQSCELGTSQDSSQTENPPHSPKKVYSTSLPYTREAVRYQFHATVPLHYDYSFRENHIDSSSDDRNESSEESANDTSNEVVSTDSFLFQNEDSDCEKEVESFFLDKLDPPPHSSTPKVISKKYTSTPYKKIVQIDYQMEAIKRANPKTEPQPVCVQQWLGEVEQLYEPECMTTLQSKSIAMDLACHVSRLAEEVTAPVKEMMKHSRIITKEFNQIKMHISNRATDHLGPLSQSLVGNITEFVLKYITHFQSNGLTAADQREIGVHKLLEIVKQLRQASMVSKPDLDDIQNLISNLQDVYFTAEHNLMGMQIQLLMNMIEDPKSHLMLRAVLSGITMLALQCERLSNLVVRIGGPRALLILCVECKASTIRTMALRTLATVCCSTTAIRQLEQADGIEVLADILSDHNRPEPELSEAVAVLAQITAPWIEDNHKVQGLSENIESLIESITHFLEKTDCCQNLLLCAAALANLTYMNLNTIGPLIQHNTLGKLLTAVRNRGPKASVFLKEQTATLIANLSDIPESRAYIADNNAAVALLCFLQVTPVHPQDEAHCNSAQRLQQKSAIALSRLCSDVEVAKQIVELGGVTRLTQLCKDGRERNYSDAVLVACLATLRKIVANCGNDIMDQQDVMELVEPRLLDSFLAYSSQNESYV